MFVERDSSDTRTSDTWHHPWKKTGIATMDRGSSLSFGPFPSSYAFFSFYFHFLFIFSFLFLFSFSFLPFRPIVIVILQGYCFLFIPVVIHSDAFKLFFFLCCSFFCEYVLNSTKQVQHDHRSSLEDYDHKATLSLFCS